FAIVSPTGPPPIIATFLSLSKFICLSVSIRIVIQKWHITVWALRGRGFSAENIDRSTKLQI
ncbi:hypothetical protein PG279_08385, partial [Riemerella anatipestifer]|nr:hypothetical protein [Riemerella anatipestifer]